MGGTAMGRRKGKADCIAASAFSHPLSPNTYADRVRYVLSYGTVMEVKVSTTEFRKNLFSLADRALEGELIEIVHKGRNLRLAVQDAPSKMARLAPDPLLKGVNPADIEKALKEISKQANAEWNRKWDKR